MNVFVTGNSSGLGHALTRAWLHQGDDVYGMSRRGCSGLTGNLFDRRCDLSQLEAIDAELGRLLDNAPRMDLLFLNAGILGPLKDLSETTQRDIDHVMKVNTWSNKVILDWFIHRRQHPPQVILVSSGASVRGGAGWNAYSLSKATLNMLAQLYAHEMPRSHLTALAPGLVDTAMQARISDPQTLDTGRYPDFQRLRDARSGGTMPTSDEAAARIIEVLPALRQYPSGSFVDIRDL